ncbi:hypothetical protein Leryth_002135, partial [Lithospermum erythrorhizon]
MGDFNRMKLSFKSGYCCQLQQHQQAFLQTTSIHTMHLQRGCSNLLKQLSLTPSSVRTFSRNHVPPSS